MKPEIWFLIIGGLLIGMALIGSFLKRLPLTAAMLYLLAGIALGPMVSGALTIDPLQRSVLLERVSEIAVIVALFTAGLKLRLPFRDRLWRVPLTLAFLSMGITVAFIACAGVWIIGLPPGAAVLLGAILAPTDPVLASDVQLDQPSGRDRDGHRLRFSLTCEAGLNDGTAFPFVMLGLGLLGVHEIGAFGWRWFVVDLLWATLGGLGIGGLLGYGVGRLVIHLRRVHKEAVGLDEFLALGLIAFSYGLAIAAHAYGFLSVFAAALALRAVERHFSDMPATPELRAMAKLGAADEIATHPEKAPAYMAGAVLSFNEQFERLLVVGLVLLVGVMLAVADLGWRFAAFVVLLLFVIRPLSILPVAFGDALTRRESGLVAWFGIRGIGSVYYLMYAINHDLPPGIAEKLLHVTLIVIAVSIVLHGISVRPLLKRHEDRAKRRKGGKG